MAVSLLGTIFDDLNFSHQQDAGEAGVPGVVAYLDLNQNGLLDGAVTEAAGSAEITPGSFGLVASAKKATLQAAGLGRISDINVRLHVTNTSAQPVIVGLVSPRGASLGGGLDNALFNGSNLLVLKASAFDGVLDDQAATRVTLGGTTGAFKPDQPFDAPHAHHYDGDANGAWGLVFFGSDLSGLTLHSWSITFTEAEPSALSGADGQFSFSDLAPGSYDVRIVTPPGNLNTGAAVRAVQVSAGQTTAGVNFGLSAAPAVAPVSPAPSQAVTSDAAVQQMPSIAVDPTDPSHLVMAFMDYSIGVDGFAGIRVAHSHDGGATWPDAERVALSLPSDFNQAAGHPIAQFDAQGRMYVAFMAATFKGAKPGVIYDIATISGASGRALGLQANNGIFVARSDDGANWTVSPVASNIFTAPNKVPFETLPDIAVDTSTLLSNGFNPIYATWTRFYPNGKFPGGGTNPAAGGTDIMLAVSHDGGQTWTLRKSGDDANGAPITIIKDPIAGNNNNAAEGGGFSTLSHVTVGPEGDIYVTAFAGGRFAVFHSFDGGVTVTAPDLNSVHAYPFGGATSNSASATLFAGGFRTFSSRAIVADPAQPGRVYVAESISVLNTARLQVDVGQIVFARSDDYGVTWQHVFATGANLSNFDELSGIQQNDYRSAVNDDNAGRFLKFADNLQQEAITGQTMPRLSVDAQGNIVLIWYDTRRDPAGRNVDVYGAVSRDGGLTFSGNFRLTGATFDSSKGTFTDARAANNTYLGDLLGLTVANGVAYASWTGTDSRAKNQDIYFASFPLAAETPPPFTGDRYEPNDNEASAVNLGLVSLDRIVPRLEITGDNDDWFKLTAAATGELLVRVQADAFASNLRIELWDATGATPILIPATVTDVHDLSGQVIGKQILHSGPSNKNYLVRVFAVNLEGTGRIDYSLKLHSQTSDLGTRVYGTQSGDLTAGALHLYPLVVPLAGSLELRFDPAAPDMRVRVLAADGTQLAAKASTISLKVNPGQLVLLEVSGSTATSQGAYTLEFKNLDQFQTSQNGALAFPVEGFASFVATGDVDGDGHLDVVASSNQLADVVNVLLGNGDGTFEAARSFTVGAGLNAVPVRELRLIDVNHDQRLDIIVTNHNSADVSVLLGRGDGSFEPQRRFDAIRLPDSLGVGDFNGDSHIDLVVLERFSGPARFALLLGNGDGTFQPPQTFGIPFETTAFPVRVADFNNDGRSDLAIFGTNAGRFQVLLGGGDGTFTDMGLFAAGEITLEAQVADLNGDGKLDIVAAGANTSSVFMILGNGDGTFQPPNNPAIAGAAGVVVVPPQPGDNMAVVGLTVGDFGGFNPTNGASIFGAAPDNVPDVVVTVRARSGATPPQAAFLAGIKNAAGVYSLRPPAALGNLPSAGKLAAGDLNQDNRQDIVMAGANGINVFFGQKPTIAPNSTLATARDLGQVVHLVAQPMAIVPGFANAYFKLTVPVEASAAAGDQVLDFSALFQHTASAGLGMEVLDEAGGVLASGERFRLIAPQGEVLYVRIFGHDAASAGMFTLVIDVLPQLVDVRAESLFPAGDGEPGGAVTSLVLTLQGDRLDRAAAENPDNYVVRWAGADTHFGTGDDVLLPVVAVYNPGANVDVSTGRTFASAVKQTITLLFDRALPNGRVAVEISPAVRSAEVHAVEQELLAASHPIVSVVGGQAVDGAYAEIDVNVRADWRTQVDLTAYDAGTSFLTQLHNDLGARLDALLNQLGDGPTITDALSGQVLARLLPGLQAFAVPYLIVWLDPVSIDLADPGGNRAIMNLQTNTVTSTMTRTFVEVGGNVQLLVMAAASGTFTLNVDHVQPTARGGAVMIQPGQVQTVALTNALRGGEQTFSFDMGQPPAGTPPGTPPGGTTPGGSASPGTQTAGLTSAPIIDLGAAASAFSAVPATAALVTLTETAVLTTLLLDVGAAGVLALDDAQATAAEPTVAAVIGNVVTALRGALPDRDAVVVGGEAVVSIFGAVDSLLGDLGMADVAQPAAGVLRDLAGAARQIGASVTQQLGGWLRRANGANPRGAVGNVPAPPMPELPKQEMEQDQKWEAVAAADAVDNVVPALAVPAVVAAACVPATEEKAVSGLLAAAVFASGALAGTLPRSPQRRSRWPFGWFGRETAAPSR